MERTRNRGTSRGRVVNKKRTILTGDRPSGPLHLGHYVGSLKNRVLLQESHEQFIMIADVQALTDNFKHPEMVRKNVYEVALDYLSVGIDPEKSTLFIQSCIPQISELAVFYLNLVTVNRLRRNPTIKTEIAQKGYGEQVTAGFLMYPVHQAADITIIKGTIVPVGADQMPILEQTNEIIHTFNRIYKTSFFEPVEGLLSSAPRLIGLDGKAKMSKSLGNAIFLSDDSDTVLKKVMSMYTDPNHLHVHEPGKIEGNVVFSYLDIFDSNSDEVLGLKEHYTRGGLGDVVIKKRLASILNTLLDPIRERRAYYNNHFDFVTQSLAKGTECARLRAESTMDEVRKVMHLNY